MWEIMVILWKDGTKPCSCWMLAVILVRVDVVCVYSAIRRNGKTCTRYRYPYILLCTVYCKTVECCQFVLSRPYMCLQPILYTLHTSYAYVLLSALC